MRLLVSLIFLVAAVFGSGPEAIAAMPDKPAPPVSSADPKVKQVGPGTFRGVKKWKERESKKTTVQGSRSNGRTLDLPNKSPKPRLTKAQWTAFLAMCIQTYNDSGCRETTAKTKPNKAKVTASLDSIARTLIVQLQLPDPTPRFGPDPAVNEWKMAAVGYPLWLWTDGPTTVSNQVQAFGVTFTLRATWLSTTFDMGDGHQVNCTSTRVYPKRITPGTKSPVCGYTYLTSSLPKGNYEVTATTNWQISWRALGQSGSLPGSHSGSWALPVGELNALVVR